MNHLICDGVTPFEAMQQSTGDLFYTFINFAILFSGKSADWTLLARS